MEDLRQSIMELGEPRQLVLPPCPTCGDNRVVLARQVKKEEIESNPIFSEFYRQSQAAPAAAAAAANGAGVAYRRTSRRSSR